MPKREVVTRPDYDFLDKRCAAIGDEHMFQHGMCRLETCIEQLDRLSAISNNPTICRKLKKLEVIGTITGLAELVTHSQLDESREYSQYSRETFRECIRRLANLESIELRVNTSMQLGADEKGLLPMSLGQMSCFLHDIQSSSGLKVKSLKSQDLFWHSPRRIGLGLFHGPAQLDTTQDRAARLSCLDVTFRALDRDTMTLQGAHLLTFLASTPNLEELTLQCGHPDKSEAEWAFEFNPVCQLRFSRLRSLGLSYGNVLQSVLLEFLNAHTSLKTVRLGTLHLRGGRWNTLLNRISESPITLEKFLLSGRLRDAWVHRQGLFVCGDHLTPGAEKKVVGNDSVVMEYPADPQRALMTSCLLDHATRKDRIAAGLPCDLCATCGKLKPASD